MNRGIKWHPDIAIKDGEIEMYIDRLEDFAIVDDPLCVQDYDPNKRKEHVSDWYERMILGGRIAPPLFLSMPTRLHEDDLPGLIIRSES